MTLTVTDLVVEIGGRRLVDGLSFEIESGGRFGIIGESGSGKSLTVLALVGLAPPEATISGSVLLDGREILGLRERDLATVRGSEIGMVFQDPLTALNPLHTVGRQIAEPLRLHERLSKNQARARAVEAIREVGLPDPESFVDLYPHQISGGQRQRVGIAIALVSRPALVIADEPTTALDVTTQAEILELFTRLVDERGMTLVFVTHDLAVLAQVTREVLVLSQGTSVEQGSVEQILHSPDHAVTKALVTAARATTWSAS